MSEIDNTTSSNCEILECPICFDNIDIFAFGSCNHVVCIKCAATMRLLCHSKRCSVCRDEMDVIIFLSEMKTFESVNLGNLMIFCGIHLDEWSKSKLLFLLRYQCTFCQEDFSSMPALMKHMQCHNRSYCQTCVDHIKIFPRFHELYTGKELRDHTFNYNDKLSGHRFCSFCNLELFDSDDYRQHNRRNHFNCFICDFSESNVTFFESYEELKLHFSSKHYMCSLDGCEREHFSNVFQTQNDYHCHLIECHSDKLSQKQRLEYSTFKFSSTVTPTEPTNLIPGVTIYNNEMYQPVTTKVFSDPPSRYEYSEQDFPSLHQLRFSQSQKNEDEFDFVIGEKKKIESNCVKTPSSSASLSTHNKINLRGQWRVNSENPSYSTIQKNNLFYSEFPSLCTEKPTHFPSFPPTEEIILKVDNSEIDPLQKSNKKRKKKKKKTFEPPDADIINLLKVSASNVVPKSTSKYAASFAKITNYMSLAQYEAKLYKTKKK
ncbi:hypothetical protein A3Q56_00730 [Intoshia linei]|uniref:Uncharacterized protein n=1 Tax=Intoshia linei TaxID=1819745 RepID=A0A177BBE6_9BILA|nr:hypothetical protein A3Q56_00730 [Intoshia linei]